MDQIRPLGPSNIGTPPSVGEYAAVDQMLLPPRKTQCPEDRASDVEVVLNWMRSNKNESRRIKYDDDAVVD